MLYERLPEALPNTLASIREGIVVSRNLLIKLMKDEKVAYGGGPLLGFSDTVKISPRKACVVIHTERPRKDNQKKEVGMKKVGVRGADGSEQSNPRRPSSRPQPQHAA